MKVRDNFIETFKDQIALNCTGMYYETELCMYEPDTDPMGPFVTANWAVLIPLDKFYETVSWIMQNRGIYDILVHPNTGCYMEDHDQWAFWGGKPWRINMDAFSRDRPYP